ncbi:MAG: hypothetical protein AAFR22_02475, partial [Chloroflexota bacterium]
TVLSRYSTDGAAIIVGLGLSLPLLPLLLRMVMRLTAHLPGGLLLWGAIMAIAVLWWVPVASAAPYMVLRFYLSYLAFSVVRARSADDIPVRYLLSVLVFVIVGVLVAAVRYPHMLWTDEGYFISAALGFQSMGAPVPLYWLPLESSSYSLAYIGLSYWMQVFGVSHLAARYFVLLLGFATVAITASIARREYGPLPALIVVLLGTVAALHLNVLRQDILVGLYIAAGIYALTVAWRNDDAPLWYVVAGVLFGFCVDGHPLGYRFALGSGVFMAVEYGLHLREQRRFAVWWPFFAFAAGGIAGVAVYIGLHSLMAGGFGNSAGGSPFFFGFRLEMLRIQLTELLRNLPVTGVLALVGVVIAGYRHSRMDRLLLLLATAGVLTFVGLYGTFRSYYLAHTLPMLLLLGAGAIHTLRERYGLALVLLAAASTGVVARNVQNVPAQDYRPVLHMATAMRDYIPPETRIVGLDPLYVRMADYDFFEQQAYNLVAQQQGIPQRAVWERIAPDAVVLIERYPLAPPPELLDYMDAEGFALAACWAHDITGVVGLYVRGVPATDGTCEAVP